MNPRKEINKEIMKTRQNISKILKNFTQDIPKIEIPAFNLAESPEVIKERNNWQRHEELMNVQDSILKIQESTFKEQKSTSKLTKVILIITVVVAVISIVSLIKSFSII